MGSNTLLLTMHLIYDFKVIVLRCFRAMMYVKKGRKVEAIFFSMFFFTFDATNGKFCGRILIAGEAKIKKICCRWFSLI